MSTKGSPYGIFAILWIASIVIWWPVAEATLSLALHQDAYTHILLILPISLTLIALQWKEQPRKPAPSIRAGAVVLALAALIGVGGLQWGHADIFTGDVRLATEILALVTWWLGSFVLCFGRAISRKCVFSLLFLFWLVPLPEIVLNHITDLLRTGTAWLTSLMLATVGVPVAQDGTRLVIPGLKLEIAEQCSSIRSSMMLVISTMVMSYLLLHSFRNRVIVTLAAIPLSIAKNALRVFTLAILGAYVDRSVLNGPLHHKGGGLFLAVSLVWVAGLIWFMRTMESKTSSRPWGSSGQSRPESDDLNGAETCKSMSTL